MSRLDARQLLDLVLDDASFVSWDTPVPDYRPSPGSAYAAELA